MVVGALSSDGGVLVVGEGDGQVQPEGSAFFLFVFDSDASGEHGCQLVVNGSGIPPRPAGKTVPPAKKVL